MTRLMIVGIALAAAAGAVACGGAPAPDSTFPDDVGLGNDRHATRHANQAGSAAGSAAAMPDGGDGGDGDGPGDMDQQMGGDSHESQTGTMADLPPSLVAFHESLAPRWHADKGPKRMADTCAAIGELRTRANDVAAALPPARADATTWQERGKQLAAAVSALDGPCKAKDAAAFESTFATVHKSFHDLMTVAGGEHEQAESK